MKLRDAADFRCLIEARLEALAAEDEATRQDRDVVTLDQQSVGRLSRMDAMQQQAMAKATHQRRQQERQRLRAALKRLEAGEFGYCDECGDDIDPARLEINPTVTLCISCARGEA